MAYNDKFRQEARITNTGVACNVAPEGSAINESEYGVSITSGKKSVARNTGTKGVAIAADKTAYAVNSGVFGVAIGLGSGCMVKSSLGGLLVGIYRDPTGEIKSVSIAKVDGKKIKPDQFYVANPFGGFDIVR